MNTEGKIAQPVLVTGATGFIGSRVVDQFLQDNVAVKALLLPDEAVPFEWADRVDIIHGTVSDFRAVERAAEGAKTIIHLAAVVSDWGDEKKYWECTVEGSRLVFEKAIKNKSRVVLASSIVVYGDKIRSQSCPEETAYGKIFGPYGRTKQAQERLAWDYQDKGMMLSVVRPANVYGPRSRPWLHDVINVLRSGAPGLVSGGNMNAGLAYVDNVADIFILTASAEVAIGRVYNACDGLDVSWKRYFTDIAGIIGHQNPKSVPRPLAALGALLFEAIWKIFDVEKRPPITREALNLVGSDNRIPIDRIRNELGYNPRISYDEGLRRTREYIEKTLMK
jgi:2-alkyl-3-oxoalkanoate reductase